MCGIVGYIGKKDSIPILIEGLKRLEYRGYDSAGIATINNDELFVAKKKGKVSDLEDLMNQHKITSNIGIGHTRWATHGEPNQTNAHPHFDCHNRIALVHNGIIENYESLRVYLEEKGHHFKSETDTEVVVHLIEEFLKDDNVNFLKALTETIQTIEGSYALAIFNSGLLIVF